MKMGGAFCATLPRTMKMSARPGCAKDSDTKSKLSSKIKSDFMADRFES